MALNGTLQTLSLPNLIQLHCGQQQNALVRLVRPGREGTLAFANGELIHASAGTLTGEQALTELLAWEDGEFHVTDGIDFLPPRNVNAPWSMLLLDALHRIDEARAERNAAAEALLRQSKSRKEFRDAVLTSPDGKLYAAATDGLPERDTAFVLFIAGRARALGNVIHLGAFEQLLAIRPDEKTWIEMIDESIIGCWLEERASIEPLKAMIQTLWKSPQQKTK
jgi:hypothetical protein